MRSIPACTGEPENEQSPQAGVWVYPRVYGGTEMKAFRQPWRNGLSPRVRGNLLVHGLYAGVDRSIPACTGEPVCGNMSTNVKGVYPRVYGGTLSR